MKHIYLTLIFITLFSTSGAVFCFYYTNIYHELSISPKHDIIENNINTAEDMNSLKRLAHHLHTNYTTVLEDHGDSYNIFGKVLASIALICALLIFTIYKYTFSNNSFKVARKKRGLDAAQNTRSAT